MLYYRSIIPCRRLAQGKSWASQTRSSNLSALCTAPGPGAEGGWLAHIVIHLLKVFEGSS